MAVNSQPRSISPEVQHDYDVTRMCEDDFERLAVYIVPDVACERGVSSRAEKTLPRSLVLKASAVLSTPSIKVDYYLIIYFLLISEYLQTHLVCWHCTGNHIENIAIHLFSNANLLTYFVYIHSNGA